MELPPCAVCDRAGDSNHASNATPLSSVAPKRATVSTPPVRRISRTPSSMALS